ncbi:protease inhibitor I42 family protein [Nocardia sp. NBC_01377]|uniref:protease inhibitor I42 family protein n=1 Tax=Nocardia sp. NBC_01377 TaxID=2903595 RepID=UPI0038679CDB
MEVRLGDLVTLELEELVSAGYRWGVVLDNAPVLEMFDSEYEPLQSNLLGSPGSAMSDFKRHPQEREPSKPGCDSPGNP